MRDKRKLDITIGIAGRGWVLDIRFRLGNIGLSGTG